MLAVVLSVCAGSLPVQGLAPCTDTSAFARLTGGMAQWGYQAPEPYYAERLVEYAAQGYVSAPDVWIDLAGPDFAAQSGSDVARISGVGGRETPILAWSEGDGGGWIEWVFDVPVDGLYNLGIEYYPLPGKRASIQRDLQIDGEYPFIEARRLVFERTWQDAHPPDRDNQGHDIRPPQRQVPRWRFQILEDAQGMYRAPYLFYLKAGQHAVRLGMIREPLAVARISLLTPLNG